MNKFLIIADDFTGASDTGVQFRKRGLDIEIVFDSNLIKSNESVVLDTESRGLNSFEAYNRVKETIKKLNEYSFDCIYKKIDSTLRGNIGLEIKAIDEIYKPDLIVFAPAYPENNRTTINGIHMLNGIPISQTEISQDPKKPVKIDNIKSLLKNEMNEEVTHIFLNELREGNIKYNSKVLTFDSITNEDLVAIVENIIKLNKKVLWVGSAGLADALLKVIFTSPPVLTVVGSVSNVSREQVNYLVSKGIYAINCNIVSLLENEDITHIIEKAIKLIKEGKDIVLGSALTIDDFNEAIKVGALKGMKKEDVSIFAQNILGKITREIIDRVKIAGLFVTGGDTAIEVIKNLNAGGVKIEREILPGIPLLTIKGGKHEGLKLVTKAGAFGNEDAIDYCIKKIKEKY